ncbi:hypothetical protein Tco_1485955 [Tanacetum coccineum]
MSNQQDIYVVGFETRPPMLNKKNYVPWSSCLLRYAKSRPKGKLIYNSIMNGPYVRQMIPELSDPDREVPVNETFHEQTDEELTKKSLNKTLGIKMGIANQNSNMNSNVVAARADGNANGNNVRPMRRDDAYLQTKLLIAQKEEAGIQLQAKVFDLIDDVGDLDEIEEVNANCILMASL